jgi:hypothetical protein
MISGFLLGNISPSPDSNIITDLLVSLQPKHSPSTTHILDPIFQWLYFFFCILNKFHSVAIYVSGGFAKYRSAVFLNRFVICMTNIITPNMDKIVFIKIIMVVVVTSVGVLQHNINNTTAQEQPPATVKVAAGGGNSFIGWNL